MNTRKLSELQFSSPDLIFYENRLKTFDLWPPQIQQNKFQLSKTGFFYTGKNDTVECFSCGLMLCPLQKNDEPFIEHKVHSSNCLFLQIIGHVKSENSSWDLWSSIEPLSASRPLSLFANGFDTPEKFKNSKF